MVKKTKENKYSTIIALKVSVKRMSEARDKWKEEQGKIGQVGLVPFMLYILDFYESNRDKVSNNENKG